MPARKRSASWLFVFAIFAVTFLATTPAVSQEKVLYSFTNYPPSSGLVFDASGNLYGVSENGANSLGSLFELSPAKVGGWFERVLFSFNRTKQVPGIFPDANLTVDGSGNLYGTTLEAGANTYGTVFELKHWPDGGWTLKVLSALAGLGDRPQSPLIFDAAGNLYGTTHAGGGGTFRGTVFELSPTAGGTWTAKVLHGFTGNRTDGYAPMGNLVFDAAGNLYGIAESGGASGNGAVYELTPESDGTWSEKLLHSFQKNNGDGLNPQNGLIIDSSGNLYGTTILGGAYGTEGTTPGGTVFELTPTSGGEWTETLLHSFGNGADGSYPNGLNFDAAGNLYGETRSGGTYGGGTVFKLSSTTGGTWTETILHNFGHGTDGAAPGGGLAFDPAGNLYGLATAGGKHQYGMAFEITP